MKYCPKCGTPREGKFCTACGHAFGDASTSNQANLQQGAWLADPSNPSLERYWNGFSWTAQTRPVDDPAAKKAAKADLLKRLKYGTGFDKTLHCKNCGKPLRRAKTCSDCAGDDL